MKRLLFIAAVLIIFAMNLFVTKTNNSMKKLVLNPQFNIAYASSGANCWSQTMPQAGASVLRCIVCDYKENSIGVGIHDGKYPNHQE